MIQSNKKIINYDKGDNSNAQLDVKITNEEGEGKSKFLKYYEKYMLLMGIGGQSLFYLQAFKIFFTRNAQGVSVSGFTIALISLVSWLIYGVLIKDKILIRVNIVAVVGAVLTLIAIFWVS
ncbi:MAG: hypothetical protein J0H87_08120 [Holosporales bacterium]|nr:hypothetical protein [Holosporales bacterium]